MADKFLKLANGILVEAEADHGGLAGLGDDDHAQYLHLNKASQEILQPITLTKADGVAFIVRSGDDAKWAGWGIGRSATEFYFGMAAGLHHFLDYTEAGDVVFRLDAATKKIHFGVGTSGLAELSIMNGKIGMNKVAPDYKLHVVGTTDADARIGIEATAADGNAYLSLKNDARTFLFGVAGWDSDSFIIFDENASAIRMRISSAGVVNFGNFQVGSDGDIEKIKNVSLDWPSANAAGVLKNNGSGSLSWDSQTDLVGEGHIFLAFYNYNSQDTGTWNPQVYTSSYLNGNIYNSTHNDGDEISWKAFLAAGTYTLRVCYHKDSHSGIVDFYIDSTEVGSVDTYAGSFSGNNLYTATGISVGTSGLKTIKAKVDGKNASSDNHYAQIVSIALWRTA